MKDKNDESLNPFCKWVAKWPFKSLVIASIIQISPIVVTIFLAKFGFNPFPTDFSDIPLQLTNDDSYKRAVAWNLRNKDPLEPMYHSPILTDHFTRHQVADLIELFYEADEDLLMPEYISVIGEFENNLTQVSQFTEFCVLDAKEHCETVQSLLTFLNVECYDPDCPDMAELPNRLQSAAQSRSGHSNLREFMGKNEDLEKFPIKAKHIRSYLRLSWVEKEQKARMNEDALETTAEFASKILNPLLWKITQSGLLTTTGKQINFHYYNRLLHLDRLHDQVVADQFLAFGSFSFILFFLILQTKSFFIVTCSLLGIMGNFFAANLIYRYIFDFRYFGILNVLSIFIILGIGVDDIFVFNDAWNVSCTKIQDENMALRLSVCYRKSSISMLITSFTTTMAFVVNAFSPLLAISSFGLFSALLVAVNYLSVITYFPTVIMFHHEVVQGICCSSASTAKASSMSKPSRLCSIYSHLIWNPGVQAAYLCLSALVLGFLSYAASNLVVDNELMNLYVRSHPLSVAKWKKDQHFVESSSKSSGSSVQLYFVWGFKGLDRSHCHKTDWKSCSGNIIWDDHFDLNEYHAQGDLLWFCEHLRNMPQPTIEKLHAKRDNTGRIDMNCFLEDLDTFYQDSTSNGLPLKEQHILSLMKEHPEIYDIGRTTRNKYFNRYFETALIHWLNDGFKFVVQQQKKKNAKIIFNSLSKSVRNGNKILLPSWQRVVRKQTNKKKLTTTASLMYDALHKYGPLLGTSINSSDLLETKQNEKLTLHYGSKLRYAAIVINTTMPLNISYTTGLDVMERWEDLLQNAKLKMAPGLRSGVIITPGHHGVGAGMHHWMKFQKTITTSAIQGILISLLIAFPILVLSTNNFLLGILATLMICCTTISVVGVIPLAGWKLGILESLNLTLVVGMAIDYIVHVAEAYHFSQQPTRQLKVEEVLKETGLSVLSGAVSTLGASFFLLFAKIVFFMQFGLFIFCTVGFSLFFSLGMFVVLLSLVGPENNKFALRRT